MTLTESDVEQVTLEWLSGLGWGVAHGPDIAPDTPNAERNSKLSSYMRRVENELA